MFFASVALARKNCDADESSFIPSSEAISLCDLFSNT